MTELSIGTKWDFGHAAPVEVRLPSLRILARLRLRRMQRRQRRLLRLLGEADTRLLGDLGLKASRRDWLNAYLQR